MADTERMPRRRAAAALAVAVLALTAGVSGCSGPDSPDAVCVPTLGVSPSDPKPGRIVTVATTRPCPSPEGTEWVVRIQPEGATIPLSQARVRPDADGDFAVSITVPPTIRPGAAIAWIANYWEVMECPEGASCASAEVGFTVAAP